MTLNTASKFPDWIFFTAVSIYSFLMSLLYSLYFLWFLIAIDYIGGVWLSKKNIAALLQYVKSLVLNHVKEGENNYYYLEFIEPQDEAIIMHYNGIVERK